MVARFRPRVTRPQARRTERRAWGRAIPGPLQRRFNMKMMCGIGMIVGILNVVPAMAGDYGGGFTNIWSGAQGTSFSYGNATANSASGSTASGIGGGGYQGTLSSIAGVTGSTSSFASTASYGSGYAQAQTSGYAGGTSTGAAGRSH